MSPIFVPVVVAPVDPVVPAEEVREHPHYHHGFTLIGGDGSVWDLVAGPVYILAGASGFGFPEPTHYWSESPLVDGAVHRGVHYGKREDIALPLEVDGRNLLPADWRVLETAFWRAVNPRRDFQLQVTAPTGERRTLTMRYSGGGDDATTLDPLVQPDNVYALEAVAGMPFWLGDPVSVTFGIDNSTPTFPGPPFALGDSTAISSGASVTNPGDEDSYALVTVTGPYSSATVTINGSTVALSTPILTGDSRVIEMDPHRASIRRADGTLAWSETTQRAFAPIPAGAEVPISMAVAGGVSGQTTITLEFDTRYQRAFS